MTGYLGRDVDEDGEGIKSGWSRWLPLLVVTSVLTGFVALAWYAYHAGMQSMREENLLVVEAEKTPIKEKPIDPGGIQFPNQDKTIFDTFAGKSKQQAKVERVLPLPEEPMPKNIDGSETSSWINDASRKKAYELPTPEQIFAKDEKKPRPLVGSDHKIVKTFPPAESDSESYVAPRVVETTELLASPKAEPLHSQEQKAVAKILPQKDSAYKIQLGAYRSEKEAIEAWNSIKKKQSALSGREPLIIKVDLGKKGIYYRLRVSGFSSTAEAKTFCTNLKGQPCMLSLGE